MPDRTIALGARSLLALLLAGVAYGLANVVGGSIAALAHFPAGGAGRLLWDLGWVYVAGVAAAALAAALAPARARLHVALVFTMLLVVAIAAVLQLGGDWPPWFSAGVLFGLPLQAWLGLRLVRRGAGSAPPSARRGVRRASRRDA